MNGGVAHSSLSSRNDNDDHHDDHNTSTTPLLSSGKVTSTNVSLPTPTETIVKPKKEVLHYYYYPKQQQEELLYIPSHKLHQKDYFSGSLFLSRKTFLTKLQPRHFVKLESASFEILTMQRQKAKMLVDWTALCVEHFSHWWKTLYGILEYLVIIIEGNTTTASTNDRSRTIQDQQQQETLLLLMQRIVEIFLKYIQVTAPHQFQGNLEWWRRYHHYHYHHGDKKKKKEQEQQEQEHPMQRTIAAIAYQPYRLLLPSKRNLTLSSQLAVVEELLTVHSLAATIASMVATGFGRILVVGYHQQHHHSLDEEEEIPSLVQKAFALVKNAFSLQQHDDDIRIQLEKEEDAGEEEGNNDATFTTSLGYAAITDPTWVRNYRRKKLFNLQMGVVTGLQTALKGYMKYNLTKQQEWLGRRRRIPSSNNSTGGSDKMMIHEYWKYVFLTEPDLLLHTKPWVLPLLAKGMEEKEELSFFPHRLQPLPHQADFLDDNLGQNHHHPNTAAAEQQQQQQASTTMQESHRLLLLLYSYLLPKDSLPFSNITTLYDDYSSCCDEWSTTSNNSSAVGDGDNDDNYYPGRAAEFGWRRHQVPCEDWWWTCGYIHNAKNKVPKDSIERRRKKNSTNLQQQQLRLARYPMLRLQGGSGVVFGSTEQGRRCIPQKGPSCFH